MPDNTAEIHPFKGRRSAARGMENSKIDSKARHKEKLTPVQEDLIGEVNKDPWVLPFKIETKRLVTRRRTSGLDNPDRGQAHRTKPVSTGGIIPASEPNFLHSSRWGAFYTRGIKGSGWKAKSQYGTGNRLVDK